MSSLDTLKDLLDRQNQTFAEFKTANDERLKQLETKGTADAVTVGKVETLSAELDKLSDSFKALEKLATLPNRGGDPAATERQAKKLETFNLHMQEFARQNGKSGKAADAEMLAKYEAQFRDFLRDGRTDDMQGWTRQDFQVAVEGDGGFLVPPDMAGRIATRLYERSDMRAIAFVQPTGRGELVGLADTADIDAGWKGETEAPGDSGNTQIGEWAIPVETMWAQPRASTQLLADAATDVEAWVARKIADRLARLENVAFFTGNGIKKPRGITTYEAVATADSSRSWGKLQFVASGASGAFAASNPGDVLFDLEATLKPAYRAGARWTMNRATLAQVRKFKATSGDYLWQPGLQAGKPQVLIGYPVTEAEDMPAIASNSLSIAFGDFQEGYTIADRQGVAVLRDPYTAKGWVKFYTTKRVGGGVTNFDAIKFLKFAGS